MSKSNNPDILIVGSGFYGAVLAERLANDLNKKVFAFKISDTATTDTVLGLKVKYNTINSRKITWKHTDIGFIDELILDKSNL